MNKIIMYLLHSFIFLFILILVSVQLWYWNVAVVFSLVALLADAMTVQSGKTYSSKTRLVSTNPNFLSLTVYL